MLEGPYENNGYEVLKRTAEHRSARRESIRKKVLYSIQLEKKESMNQKSNQINS